MGDVSEHWRAFDANVKRLKARFGVPCPVCIARLPKASPRILLPTQLCRAHAYRDPRPRSVMDSTTSDESPIISPPAAQGDRDASLHDCHVYTPPSPMGCSVEIPQAPPAPQMKREDHGKKTNDADPGSNQSAA